MCIEAEPANEEPCILLGNVLFCKEGGTGGTGGTGGQPDPDIVCDVGLCEVAGTPKDDCKMFLAECLLAVDRRNWDECLAGALLIFCNEVNEL
jgi:hypothetical protein